MSFVPPYKLLFEIMLISHEHSHLNIDIATFSETRYAKEGNLQEHGAGFTLFSGKQSIGRWIMGEGFMVRKPTSFNLKACQRATLTTYCPCI